MVNQPQAVIPYERAAIALEKHGKLSLKAISGVEHFVPGEATVSTLQDILHWVAGSDDEVYVTQRGDEIDEEREETRAKFKKYFADTGMRPSMRCRSQMSRAASASTRSRAATLTS